MHGIYYGINRINNVIKVKSKIVLNAILEKV